jgi:glycine betaine/choline ABC-type transport system substrate-binding protein
LAKTNKFNELKDKKNTKEYEEWFLNYRPDKIINKETSKKIPKIKKTLKKKRKRKSKIFGIF